MTLARTVRLPKGAEVTFLQTGRETGGALLEFEAVVPPRWSGPPAHLHAREQEDFYVVDGRLDVRVGRAWSAAGPGDQVTVPPDTPHAFANPGADPATMRVRMTPSGNLEELLRIQATSRYLSLLRIAEVNHGAEATLFLSGIPRWPQRLTLDALAALSRLRHRPGE